MYACKFLARNERAFISSKFICVLETGVPHCKSTIRAKRFASRGAVLSLHGCNEARHFFAFRNKWRTRRRRDQIRWGIISLVPNLAPVTYAFIRVPPLMNRIPRSPWSINFAVHCYRDKIVITKFSRISKHYETLGGSSNFPRKNGDCLNYIFLEEILSSYFFISSFQAYA